MSSKRMLECRERFSALVQKSADLSDGDYEITVGKVLDIGRIGLCQPEVAIIKDDKDRILLIPEDAKCDGKNRLASRWAVKKNMNLHLTVAEGKVSDVLIGDSP